MWIGKKRASRKWALAAAVALAAAASLSLVWLMPAREEREPAAAAASEETGAREDADGATDNGASPGGTPAAEENRPLSGDETGEGGQVTAPPGEESKPPVVVNFPDPVAPEPESPPPQGYEEVAGHWVVEMHGASYGLSNCHLYLHEDGSITVPELYESVFVIQQGSYTWRKGDPSFSATMLVLIKLGPSQAQVPVELALTGEVSDALTEIEGEFSAVPTSDNYAPFAQQGAFFMRR